MALPQYCVELAFRATPTAVVQGMLRLAGGTWLLAAVAAQCLKVRILESSPGAGAHWGT